MTRWLVAFFDGVIEADSAKEAVEKAAIERGMEIDHEVFAVPIDADGIERFRIGAERVE